MPLSTTALRQFADASYASTGQVARLCLLKGDSIANLAVTVTPATDLLTTAAPHGLITGSRVRMAVSGGTLPTPLSATTDYWAILVSTTTFKLATTLANAQASTAIDLADAGTGTLTINEQTLNAEDSIAVLISKEATGYSRPAIDALGAAIYSSINGRAEKPKALTVTNTGGSPLVYRHVLIAFGSTVAATPGSTTGITGVDLRTEPADRTIAPSAAQAFALTLYTAV